MPPSMKVIWSHESLPPLERPSDASTSLLKIIVVEVFPGVLAWVDVLKRHSICLCDTSKLNGTITRVVINELSETTCLELVRLSSDDSDNSTILTTSSNICLWKVKRRRGEGEGEGGNDFEVSLCSKLSGFGGPPAKLLTPVLSSCGFYHREEGRSFVVLCQLISVVRLEVVEDTNSTSTEVGGLQAYKMMSRYISSYYFRSPSGPRPPEFNCIARLGEDKLINVNSMSLIEVWDVVTLQLIRKFRSHLPMSIIIPWWDEQHQQLLTGPDLQMFYLSQSSTSRADVCTSGLHNLLASNIIGLRHTPGHVAVSVRRDAGRNRVVVVPLLCR